MNKTFCNFYNNDQLKIEFYLLFSSGHKIKVIGNSKDSLNLLLKKYFKKETTKIKSGKLKGKRINFNKTISENEIKKGSILNITASKDFNIISFVKEFSEVEFTLFFISGHKIKVIAKPKDNFQSILKKYFKTETTKIKSGKLKDKLF